MNKIILRTMNTPQFKMRNAPFVFVSERLHDYRINYIKTSNLVSTIIVFKRLSVWAVSVISQRLIKFSPSTAGACDITKMSNISKGRMDMECGLPKTIQESISDYKRRCMHEIIS